VTEQQLADIIVDGLTKSHIEVVGVSCPCPSNEIIDSYNITIGKMNEKRGPKDKRLFGFDISDVDSTKETFSLISVLCNDNNFIRILVWNPYRLSWERSKYGETIEEIVMNLLMDIGYIKGFVSILSNMYARRYSYKEEFIDDITYRFIDLNMCNALRNVLYTDWVLLHNELIDFYDKKYELDHSWWLPNAFMLNMELLREIQRNSFNEYLLIATENNRTECTVILLKWKHEVLDNDDSGEDMKL
jgi:hypothetical protein